jgi:predicted ATPase
MRGRVGRWGRDLSLLVRVDLPVARLLGGLHELPVQSLELKEQCGSLGQLAALSGSSRVQITLQTVHLTAQVVDGLSELRLCPTVVEVSGAEGERGRGRDLMEFMSLSSLRFSCRQVR